MDSTDYLYSGLSGSLIRGFVLLADSFYWPVQNGHVIACEEKDCEDSLTPSPHFARHTRSQDKKL